MKLHGIESRQRFLILFKEFFRKTIHLCSAFVPVFLDNFYNLTLVLLISALFIYSVCEALRLNGINVPLVSAVTSAAARKRDENKFVKGPVTLCLGIIAAAVLFSPPARSAAIYALAFGDGLASLSGRIFGKIRIPLTQGKTAAGSLTCFAAIFISCFLTCLPYTQNAAFIALCTAGAGMFIEILPLKDFDNLLIPVILGSLVSALL